MGQSAVAFFHEKRAFQHNSVLDSLTRDALAAYCRHRWPTGTAKMAAREWDLSADQARAVVAGRGSLNTLDDILKHKQGGWAVIIPILGEVIGETVDQHIAKQEIRHAELAERHRALGRNLRANLASVGRLGG